MLDIGKILDFHRMVMLAAARQSHEDETSCGPLCQHPACWDSKRRQERGVPRLKDRESGEGEEKTDLPAVTCYNMLEDYGESPKDRFPARFGGRPAHDRSSSMRMRSQPLHSESWGMTTAPFATPVSPEKASRSSLLPQPGLRVVEVQEVFDQSDLNSRWDETFMTKQVLVWVPNPNRQAAKQQLAITEKGEGGKAVPRMLKPKDLTEAMVPVHIQRQREDTVLFDDWPVLKKRQDRSRSPIFQKGTYPKTPLSGMKPDVDSEGIRELLGLPRDLLVQVLDRAKESDFMSREKIHGIIQDVLDTMTERRSVHTGRDLSPPRAGTTAGASLHTGDVLLQQKAFLHYGGKQRHARDGPTWAQRPVFQLDMEDKAEEEEQVEEEEGSSSVDSPRMSGRGGGGRAMGLKESFPKYKKPLPAIAGEDAGTGQPSPREPPASTKGKRKIPSVSLGLPELPSGLRHTRAFVYNSKHRPDFSLVPVPTPPQSVRSSESAASEHGTTMRVNVPSLSDRQPASQPAAAHKIMDEDLRALYHGVSPTLSTHVPKAPAGTPATFHSPTKMVRDFTAVSSTMQAAGGDNQQPSRGLPPSRDITMSPGHKIFCVPGDTFAEQSPPSSPHDPGLSTIKETGRELSSSPKRSSQHRSVVGGGGGRGAAGGGIRFTNTPQPEGITRPQVASPDDWPQGVTEPTFDTAGGIMGSRSETAFITEHGTTMAEHGSSAHRSRSELSSRGSDRNATTTMAARRILDEGASKVESPAPPPPSPEPKEFGVGGEKTGGGVGGGAGHRGKRENKSRESTTMEPLLEQSESEGSTSPEKRPSSDRGGGAGAAAMTLERPSTQGQSLEPVIAEEEIAAGGAEIPQESSAVLSSSAVLDPVSKVMVSHVAPRPSASREKLQQTFLNVDIPAEDLSSLHAEQGSTPTLEDITPSLSASPQGKSSPSKLSHTTTTPHTPKSSAGPGSPAGKSPTHPPHPPAANAGKRGGKGGGRKNGKGRRGEGNSGGGGGGQREESA